MFASSLSELWSDVRTYVDDKVAAAMARVYHYTYYASSSNDGKNDSVDSDHSDPTSPAFSVRKLQHFGFRSIPPKGTECVRLNSYQNSGTSVVIAEDSSRYAPTDINDGETAIYNIIKDCLIKMLQSGDITIATPTGQQVLIQGGDQPIARKTDSVDMGTFKLNGVGVTFASILWVPPGGGTPVNITATAPVPLTGEISTGSSKAKCG